MLWVGGNYSNKNEILIFQNFFLEVHLVLNLGVWVGSRDENVYSLIKFQLENHSMDLPFFVGWIFNLNIE